MSNWPLASSQLPTATSQLLSPKGDAALYAGTSEHEVVPFAAMANGENPSSADNQQETCSTETTIVEDYRGRCVDASDKLRTLKRQLDEATKQMSAAHSQIAIIDFARRLIDGFAQHAAQVMRKATEDPEHPLLVMTWQRMYELAQYERVLYEELLELVGKQGSSETTRDASRVARTS